MALTPATRIAASWSCARGARLALALAAAFAACALAPQAALAKAGAPEETSPPTITGAAVQEGTALHGAPGTWSGHKPIRFAFRWLRCAAGGGACSELEATARKYTPTLADVGHTLRLQVTATNGVASLTVQSAPTAPVTGLPPSNHGLPVISGQARGGAQLTVSSGVWRSTTALSLAYQWLACNAAGESCAPIAQATGTSFAPTASQVGKTLRVAVTATNSAGEAGATSKPTKVVAAGEPPANVSLPEITGIAQQDLTLTASAGTWTGEGPLSYAYQWQRCTGPGECEAIAEAHSGSYTPVAADVGDSLRVQVTATGPLGSASAYSLQTATVIGQASDRGERLAAGEELEPGWYLQSGDGHFTLTMRGDGDLVETVATGRELWSSGTAGNAGAHLAMQGDGNLVVYSAGGEPLWSSGTSGHPGDHLLLQDDAQLVLYSSAAGPECNNALGTPVWTNHAGDPTLQAGEELRPGWYVESADGHYSLQMEAGGNLVEFVQGAHAIWNSGTAGNDGARLVAEEDGNFVIRSSDGELLWRAGTAGAGDSLTIQNDANVVVYSATGTPLWANGSTTQQTLTAGQTLEACRYLQSGDGRFTLVMQGDGNLVEYSPADVALWSSGTSGNPGAYLELAAGGQLAVRSAAGETLWSVAGAAGDHLVVQDDGNVVLYESGGGALWASGSAEGG
ncbi:MAG TPA: hypothetical protein VMA83_01485 [Solirubrobacteraceae bacterium]|nr:hypothetical protein [Solirubrobacteraceae bacterium]